ncbi:MAG: phosphoribosylglycinamide formyltransferase [Kiritimatiellia bacterium]
MYKPHIEIGFYRKSPDDWTRCGTLNGKGWIMKDKGEDTLKVGILGSGSGSNMQSIINAIEAGTLNATVKIVISDVRNAGILKRAAKHNIPAQWLDCAPYRTKLDGEAQQRCINILREHEIDTIVLAGFMRIIKPELLQAFPGRILNIHPALLPAFPGLDAWKQALDYGTKVAGCTVHFVDEGTDTGPVIIQRSVPVFNDDTYETLHARIQQEEHIAYPDALRLLSEKQLRIEGRTVRFSNSV